MDSQKRKIEETADDPIEESQDSVLNTREQERLEVLASSPVSEFGKRLASTDWKQELEKLTKRQVDFEKRINVQYFKLKSETSGQASSSSSSSAQPSELESRIHFFLLNINTIYLAEILSSCHTSVTTELNKIPTRSAWTH